MEKVTAIQDRIDGIDSVKVQTMLLVIIGHSVFLTLQTQYGGITYMPNGSYSSTIYTVLCMIVSFIYSFHMPLFMSISGMLFSKSLEKRNTNAPSIISKKAYRLLWPFVIVTLIYNTPIMYATGYFEDTESLWKDIFFGELLLLGNNHLWYVLSLFWIFISSVLIERYNIRRQYKSLFWIALIMLSIVGYIMEINAINIIGIGTSLRYLLYFYMGFQFVDNLDKLSIRNNNDVILCLGYLLGVYFLSTIGIGKIPPPFIQS